MRDPSLPGLQLPPGTKIPDLGRLAPTIPILGGTPRRLGQPLPEDIAAGIVRPEPEYVCKVCGSPVVSLYGGLGKPRRVQCRAQAGHTIARSRRKPNKKERREARRERLT